MHQTTFSVPKTTDVENLLVEVSKLGFGVRLESGGNATVMGETPVPVDEVKAILNPPAPESEPADDADADAKKAKADAEAKKKADAKAKAEADAKKTQG